MAVQKYACDVNHTQTQVKCANSALRNAEDSVAPILFVGSNATPDERKPSCLLLIEQKATSPRC